MTDKENIVRAFGVEHVVQLTGLTEGQLRSWDRTGLFCPEYAYEDRHAAYSRVYSFRDVIGLRTIAVLKKSHRVSTQELKRVARELIHKGFEHWADTKLYVVNRQVHFRPPGSDAVMGVWDGQMAMLPVIEVIQDVEARIESLQQRPSSQHGQIAKHRHVARNASVIAGTRIPTAAIRRYRDAGYSVEGILREYPSLTKSDVEAALSFEKERVA